MTNVRLLIAWAYGVDSRPISLALRHLLSAAFSHNLAATHHLCIPETGKTRRSRTPHVSGSHGASQHCRHPAMTMAIRPAPPAPQDDLQTVVEARTREWHFHIYFLLQSPAETAAALALRDAVLRLRRDGRSR